MGLMGPGRQFGNHTSKFGMNLLRSGYVRANAQSFQNGNRSIVARRFNGQDNRLVMLPGLVLATVLIALGVGMWLAALNVRFRDVRYLLPFLTQIWMFATLVIYPASLMSDRYRSIYFP